MAPKLTVVRPSPKPGADLQPSDDGAPPDELAPVFDLSDEQAAPTAPDSPPEPRGVPDGPQPRDASPTSPGSPPEPPVPVARQRLIELALPMVESCASELARCFPGLLDREELLGPGTVAMYAVIDKYRKDRYPDFVGYARHNIRLRMLNSIHAEHWSLRARVEREMERGFDKFSGHQVVDVNLFKDPVEKVVDGARDGGDEGLVAAFVAGLLEMRGASPEEVAIELEGQAATLAHLGDALGTVYPHEREVLRLVYEEDLTLDEAAVEAGVSQKTMQRRHVSALRKLRAYLLRRAVTGSRLLGG